MIQLYADYVEAWMPELAVRYEPVRVPDGTRVVSVRGDAARKIQIELGGDPAPLTDEPLRGSGYLDGWPFREETE